MLFPWMERRKGWWSLSEGSGAEEGGERSGDLEAGSQASGQLEHVRRLEG
jgi:hypothetical protein